jgi:GntR family uxuAB operon transcriptional repressor
VSPVDEKRQMTRRPSAASNPRQAEAEKAGLASAPEVRLYQIVARRMAKLIADNWQSPNWRMPSERELAEDLGVSRPVVREALIALEMRGLVEVRGRSGIVVRPPSGEPSPFDAPIGDIGPGPFELLEARLAVEASAAALAAEKATPYDIAHLQECIARMEQESDVQLLHEKGDREFHMTIARMTGNEIIVSIVQTLWEMRDDSAMWRKLHEHIHAPSVRALWIGDHHAVLAAMKLRNADAAYKAMSRHIRNVIEELLAADEAGRFGLAEAAKDENPTKI